MTTPAGTTRPSEAYDEAIASVGHDLVVIGGQVWDGDDGRLSSEAWVWRPPAS